jgi:hypothetical protein
MANRTLLTNLSLTTQVNQEYWAPASMVADYNTILTQTYAFLSAADPWPDDNDPPIPQQDQKTLKQILKNVFVVKKISIRDICPVIQRIDWQENSIYEYYRDDLDVTEKDENGVLIYNYYVMNKYYQVFKCLWNNNYGLSTIEPYFQPGTYQTNRIFKGSDGYKWKFIFNVDSGLRTRFMDDNWIPVFPTNTLPSALDNDAGCGNIDVINVLNGGSGYDPANAIIRVAITGDGTAANGIPFTTAYASAVVSDGSITDIIMTDTGKNYTYANASIVSALGSGCILGANTVSPIGGHSADPLGELSSSHVMMTIEFNGSENNIVPTDITYYQLGLIVNPVAESTYPDPANGEIYKTTTDVTVSPGFGQFLNGEIVWQGTSANFNQAINSATFVGKVLNFNTATNTLRLINTKGTPTFSQTLYGQSGTARTLLAVSNPDYVLQSGYITYIENRSGIQRSSDGIEQFRVVLGY